MSLNVTIGTCTQELDVLSIVRISRVTTCIFKITVQSEHLDSQVILPISQILNLSSLWTLD